MTTAVEDFQERTDGPFYLEHVSIPEDSEDDYKYEEVAVDDGWSLTEGDEDLETALKATWHHAEDTGTVDQRRNQEPRAVPRIPETIDDFLRNFLHKMGMHRTLECFETEWYKMARQGELRAELMGSVPDVYMHNQLLAERLKDMQRELDDHRRESLQAAKRSEKLQKERDLQRMQHKRVVQEKNRLVEDIRKLKEHHASHEPALRLLKHRYQATLKEKVTIGLERDRALRQLHGLEVSPHDGKQLQPAQPKPASGVPQAQGKFKQNTRGETGTQAVSRVSDTSAGDPTRTVAGRHSRDAEFPVDTHVNSIVSQVRALSGSSSKVSGFLLSSTLQAHTLPISCLALHPHQLLVATASDDRKWRLLDVLTGKANVVGEGHTDWLTGCSFHPDGGTLATSSGDTTIKVWDLSQGSCVLTLQGHSQAVWGCSFHSCGLFLASCSQDSTTRLWDLQSERCRATLRGHADAVNSVHFLSFSNTLLTSSADGTLCLWDARMARSSHTFYGHLYSCNHAAFNTAGDAVASCDSRGVLRLWDVRTVRTVVTVDLGPHASNQVAFSPSGRTLAVASDDGTVRVVEMGSSQVSSLTGHEDTVQSVIFDHRGERLLSGGSDGTIRIWS